MNRVLVLDALQRSALSVTRSLGKQGICVITADEYPNALAGCSRYSEKYVTYPSPQTKPDEFLISLENLIKKQNIGTVFPMTELTSELVIQNRDALHGITIPFPSIDKVNLLADKSSLMRLASSINIPVPQTWYVDNPPALPFDLNDLPYPVVLKPARSWLYTNGHWLHTSVKFADSPQHAKDILQSHVEFQNHPFMIQECVSGAGQGIFALYEHGKALAFFAHRRLREKPPHGGVSVLSESIAPPPSLLSDARALLDKAHWHGIAMVEYKVSGDEYYLMEINTRFWGSLQLAIDAGVDFPYMLYQVSNGNKLEPMNDYKTGIRLRWLLGDIDNLYLTVRDKHISVTDKFKALGRFLSPSPLKTRHEVNRLDDLGPFKFELSQYLKDLIS